MMKEEIVKLRKASESYRLNNELEITERLLEYIKSLIEENRKEIEEVIEIKKENISVDEILKLFEEDDDIYKNYRNLRIDGEFAAVEIDMPVGIIAVECYETLETIKYFLQAIKTRNAIAISDAEYDEDDVKSIILLIIKGCMKKMELDDNLINVFPYEECFYDDFDEVIYTYDEPGNLLENPKVEKKDFGDKKYVYIHSEKLRDEALKNEGAEILEGDFDDVISKIGKENAAAIYTENSEIAYKFINLVKCKNVFVNASLENCREIEDCESDFYETRNLILPYPGNVKSKEKQADEKVEVEEEVQREIKETENETKVELSENVQTEQEVKKSAEDKENFELAVKKEGIWSRIKSWLKMFFGA